MRLSQWKILLVLLWPCVIELAYAQGTWHRLGPEGSYVEAFAQDQKGTIYAAGPGGVFVRNGAEWTPQNQGLEAFDLFVYSIVVDAKDNVFISTFKSSPYSRPNAGAFKLSRLTGQWDPIGQGLPDGWLRRLGVDDSGALYVQVLIEERIYTLVPNTESWVPVTTNGLPFAWTLRDFAVTGTGDLYAAIGSFEGTIYRLLAGNPRWERYDEGIPAETQRIRAGPSGSLYASSEGWGVFTLPVGETRWQARNDGLTNLNIARLAVDIGENVLASIYNLEGTIVKLDSGTTQWRNLQAPQGGGGAPFGSSEGDTYTQYGFSESRVLRTGIYKLPAGGVWERHSEGLTGLRSTGLAVDAVGNLYAGFSNEGVQRLTPDWKQWEEVNTGLPNAHVNALTSDASGNLYVALNILPNHVHKLNNGINTWQPASTGLPQDGPVYLLVGDSEGDVYASLFGDYGIYRYSASANTWRAINEGLPAGSGTALAAKHCDAVYVSISYGVYKREKTGSTWLELNDGLLDRDVSALHCDGVYAYAGTQDGRIFRLALGASKWEEISNGLNGFRIASFTNEPEGSVYAGTANGAFKFAKDQQVWLALEKPSDPWMYYMFFHNGYLFGGTGVNSIQVYTQP